MGTLGRGGAGCPDHGTLWAQPARLAPDLPRLAAWASLARPLWPRLGPPPSAALAGMLLGLGPRQPDPTAPAMPAMPALLPWLALTGWRVTLAARGGPTAIAEPIRAPGGDALGAWKSNHHKAATALKEPWHVPIAPQGVWRTAAHCFLVSTPGWSSKRGVWRGSRRRARVTLASLWPVGRGLPPPAAR